MTIEPGAVEPAPALTPEARIGTSGWTYSNWRGRFYPTGLARTLELTYLSEQLNAVELNGTFYRLQRPTTYTKWAGQVVGDFAFAVKGWKQVTHVRKLVEAREDVARFFASGVLNLGARLGTILWQLPPSLRFEPETLSAFLAQLPRTVGEAAALAATVVVDNDANEPDEQDPTPPLLPAPEPTPEIDPTIPLRYAIEPRNTTFGAPEALALLRQHNAALVTSDSAGRHPMFTDLTADFVYVRLHGSPRLYFSRYADEVLQEWAARVVAWRAAGIGAEVFFDNTGAGHAPENAVRLRELVAAG